MDNTPSNNERDPEWCDACDTFINNDQCDCCNNGGWGWYPYHEGGNE